MNGDRRGRVAVERGESCRALTSRSPGAKANTGFGGRVDETGPETVQGGGDLLDQAGDTPGFSHQRSNFSSSSMAARIVFGTGARTTGSFFERRATRSARR